VLQAACGIGSWLVFGICVLRAVEVGFCVESLLINGIGGLITAASGNLLWRLHRSLESAGWCWFIFFFFSVGWVGLGWVGLRGALEFV
jgi:hypothetical protein